MSFNDRLGGFPRLETPRLVLREVRPGQDAEAHFGMWSDPEVLRFLPHTPVQTVEESADKLGGLKDCFYDERYVLAWAIARNDDDRFIGGLRYYQFTGHEFRIGEIGYELARGHWNQGFMTEAVKAATQFGFERLGLNRVQLTTHPANTASSRVAVKAGFQDEGTLRQWVYNPRTESWQDETMFSVLRDEHCP